MEGPKTPIRIREARLNDLDGIFGIYDHEVLHSTSTFDTVLKTPEERLTWFRLHEGKFPIFVAEESETERILGWSRLYEWSPRPAYSRTAEWAVYVGSEARGRGLGRILLQKLVDLAPQVGVRLILAKLTEENEGSIRLHERMGFKSVGTIERAGEKFGRLLNVRIMNLHLD